MIICPPIPLVEFTYSTMVLKLECRLLPPSEQELQFCLMVLVEFPLNSVFFLCQSSDEVARRYEAGRLRAMPLSFIRQIQQRPAELKCPFSASAWNEDFSKKELGVHSLCAFLPETITVNTISQWTMTSFHPPLGIILLTY